MNPTRSCVLLLAVLLACTGCHTQAANEKYEEARQAYFQADFPRSMRLVEEAISINPQFCLAYCLRGHLHLVYNNMDAALADYSQAISIDPKCEDAWLYRAELYAMMNKYESAFADYDKAIALSPGNYLNYERKGLKFYEADRFREAVDMLSMSIQHKPMDTLAFFFRGSAYEHLKLRDSALTDYNQAITLDTAYADAYRYRAGIFLHLRDFDAALTVCEKVLSLVPGDIEAQGHIALAYLQTNRYDEAKDLYEVLCRLSVNDPQQCAIYYSNLGYTCHAQGNDREAIEHINTSIAMDSINPLAHRNLARVYLDAGNLQRACEHISLALEQGYSEEYDGEMEEEQRNCIIEN